MNSCAVEHLIFAKTNVLWQQIYGDVVDFIPAVKEFQHLSTSGQDIAKIKWCFI